MRKTHDVDIAPLSITQSTKSDTLPRKHPKHSTKNRTKRLTKSTDKEQSLVGGADTTAGLKPEPIPTRVIPTKIPKPSRSIYSAISVDDFTQTLVTAGRVVGDTCPTTTECGLRDALVLQLSLKNISARTEMPIQFDFGPTTGAGIETLGLITSGRTDIYLPIQKVVIELKCGPRREDKHMHQLLMYLQSLKDEPAFGLLFVYKPAFQFMSGSSEYFRAKYDLIVDKVTKLLDVTTGKFFWHFEQIPLKH